ncbi:hypothetical protein EJB05_35178, partial [Eragrostis curvula]
MDAIQPSKKPDDGASPPSARQAEPASSSSPPDAAAADAGAGGAETTRRVEEVDDEQVERFYALLANIRAMRGMFGATATIGKRKRAREAEPPWRPAFRMEDFETEEVVSDAADAGRCGAGRRKLIKRSGVWRLPAAGSETAAVVDDEDGGEEVGEVVERTGPRRDAARGCVDQLASL